MAKCEHASTEETAMREMVEQLGDEMEMVEQLTSRSSGERKQHKQQVFKVQTTGGDGPDSVSGVRGVCMQFQQDKCTRGAAQCMFEHRKLSAEDCAKLEKYLEGFKGKPGYRQWQKQVTCFTCGRKGHIASECKWRKAKVQRAKHVQFENEDEEEVEEDVGMVLKRMSKKQRERMMEQLLVMGEKSESESDA